MCQDVRWEYVNVRWLLQISLSSPFMPEQHECLEKVEDCYMPADMFVNVMTPTLTGTSNQPVKPDTHSPVARWRGEIAFKIHIAAHAGSHQQFRNPFPIKRRQIVFSRKQAELLSKCDTHEEGDPGSGAGVRELRQNICPNNITSDHSSLDLKLEAAGVRHAHVKINFI